MPLAPELEALLQAGASSTPFHQLAPQAARRAHAQRRKLLIGPQPPLHDVSEREIPGGEIPGAAEAGKAGHTLRLRIYRPSNEANLPALLYFHGGGWVLGSPDTVDHGCRLLAQHAGCVIISASYGLAPEHPFPQAVHDCHAALRWTFAHAATLGIDHRRLAIGGDSAGANLSAAVTLLARQHDDPPIAYQLLLYPCVERLPQNASMRDNAGGYGLTAKDIVYFWKHYAPDPASADDHLACPMQAESLAGLPAADVIVAEYDPLRDEGIAYAKRLQAEGVHAKLHVYDGMIHGFAHYTGLECGRQAMRDAGRMLTQAFEEG